MIVREILAVVKNFLASAIIAAAFLVGSIRHADIADSLDLQTFSASSAESA